MKRLAPVRGEDLTQQAYAALLASVVAGELAPGVPLYEVHLAERLGMSRTPVREAMKLLAREGYLEALPSRGFAVPRRSLDDLREFFELREVLEAAASRYAALRATPTEITQLGRLCDAYEREKNDARWQQIGQDFHDHVIRAGRNQRLQTMLGSLNAQIVLSRLTVARADEVRRQAAMRDHRAIFEAIRTRDEAGALALAAEHVRCSYLTTLRAFQPDQFATQKTA